MWEKLTSWNEAPVWGSYLVSGIGPNWTETGVNILGVLHTGCRYITHLGIGVMYMDHP
jgi:hypothetical protein